MKINKVRFLKGPNFYAYSPTMFIELDLEELEYMPSDSIPGFSEALIQSIPSLEKHTCSLGYEGGFVERLKRGTWMGHILEHMAIELQVLAGIKVTRGKTVTGEKRGIYYVTYEYREQKSGLYAFEAAMEIVMELIQTKKKASISPYIEKIARVYYENKLGPSTEAVYNAALKAKIPVERVGTESLLRLGTGSKQKFVRATISSQTSSLAVESSCDKQVTKEILKRCGLPVPDGQVVATMEEIFQAAEIMGYPLVIKPLKGRQGQGVITNIKNREELFNVTNCLKSHKGPYILERHFQGNDYRLIVIGEKLIAASLRMPPFIIGNGKDSIGQLIKEENKNPLRGNGHEKPMSKIPLNKTVSCYLEKLDLSLRSVPEEGRVIQVVGNANLSTGGKAIDVTDHVHPMIKQIAVSAAKAIGLDIAGIDFICQDISKPFNRVDMAIIEINAAPGIRMHHYPSEGKARDVGKAIVDYLFKSREEAAIPIISITGTNGKTTTARLLHHFLSTEDKIVGMANSEGVYIGNECMDVGDCSGPISARKILANPLVDYAVLETARGGILREGLAFRHCDVGIITNVSEDHLGIDGIQTFKHLVKLKRLIAEMVLKTGYCVLNADDVEVVNMAEYTEGQVIYTSLTEHNSFIQQAIKMGQPAWYLDDEGWIVQTIEGITEKLLPCKDIPITIQGTAKHNISNLLQALAAAYTQGVSKEELKVQTMSFLPDMILSKGRFNRTTIMDRTIIVDYAHNPAGLKAIYDTVKGMNKKRILSVFSGPGDRKDSALKSMARMISNHSGLVIFKEDLDLRGRQPLEVALILQKACESKSLIVENETEAFLKAWELSEPDDLLLFFYTDFKNVHHFFEKVSNPTLY